MTMGRQLEFFYDCASPHSYLSDSQPCNDRTYRREVVYPPAILGQS